KCLLQRHGVSARSVFLAPKCAKPASGYADVGGVDVPVDVEVGHVAVQPLADMVGQPAHRQDIRRTIQGYSVIKGEALMGEDLVGDGQQAAVIGLKPVCLRARFGWSRGHVYTRSYRVQCQFFEGSALLDAISRTKIGLSHTSRRRPDTVFGINLPKLLCMRK